MKKQLIATILLTMLAAVPVFAQEDMLCGSVEKFNQTKRWEDLPGCAMRWSNYSAQKTLCKMRV
jgi:hypothetical protein